MSRMSSWALGELRLTTKITAGHTRGSTDETLEDNRSLVLDDAWR